MNYNSWLSGTIALLTALTFVLIFFTTWIYFFRKKNKKNYAIRLNNKLKYLCIGTLLFMLFYCDFLRAFIFQNLQLQMSYMERITNIPHSSEIVNYTDGNFLSIFGDLTANQSYLYKYLFFGIFTLIYFTISSIILKLTYPKFNTTRFTSFLYGIGVSFILIIFSLYFFPWQTETKNGFYLISMEIGHIFQSSLPTLLLLVSFKIYQSYPAENT